MPASSGLLHEAIARVAAIPGLAMSFRALGQDVVLLGEVWPNDEGFLAAASSTVRAIELARDGRVSASSLRDDLGGWCSYHYQFLRAQGVPAELRLIYRLEDGGSIRVLGFGHRYLPGDVYHRLARGRKG